MEEPIVHSNNESVNNKSPSETLSEVNTKNSPIKSKINSSDEVGYNSDSSLSASIFCRYCLEGNLSEQMISPCKCIGSLKYVHKSCLRKRIKSFDNTNVTFDEGWLCLTCELCKQKIRYSLVYENSIVYSLLISMYLIMTSLKGVSLLFVHLVVVYFCLDKFKYLATKALNFYYNKFKFRYLVNYSNEISICLFLVYILKDILKYYFSLIHGQRKEEYNFKPGENERKKEMK